jgi:hypothetical protein
MASWSKRISNWEDIRPSFRQKTDGACAWAGGRVGGRRGPRLRYERLEEFPLNPATLYVAGEQPYMWAAALLCPCGCGEVIELNLMELASPRWSVREHRDGSVTLVPSVWRTKGCRSDFLVRHSRIDWCRSNSQSPPTA